MVSGLVTSPWDQERIFSGLARRILIASKSTTTRPRSRFGLIGIIRLISSCLSVLGLDQLDVQAQALQITDEHVERLGQTGVEHGVALHDGLVDLGPTVHVVGLGGEELLQDVGRPVRLEGPDLHLPEPLAPELGLAPQGLLGDERVWPDGPRVDLVVHQVGELQHVDVAHADLLLEGLSRHAVDEGHLAVLELVRPQGIALGLPLVGLLQETLDLLLCGPVEDGGGEVQAQGLRRPTEVGLQDLSHVHARGDAERVQDDLHRAPVREVGHVLVGQDAGDHALVAVAPRHLVAHGELALHGHEDLDQLDDPGGQLVAPLEAALLLREQRLQHLDLALRLVDDLVERLLHVPLVVALHAQLQDVGVPELLEGLPGELLALLDQLLPAEVHEVGGGGGAVEQVLDPLVALVLEDADLVLEVLLHHEELGVLDLTGPLVLLHTLPGEDLHVHHDPLDAGRADQGGVPYVARLLPEDRAQQLLLGSELGLALGGDLAHQDVARLHAGPDADDPALVEVVEEGLRDVGDVAGHFLGAELGVPGLDLELLDVDRGVHVLLDQLLADQDRVLEVVAPPGHEGHEHVAAQGQLAHVGAGAVGQDLALGHVHPDLDDGLLVDARVLVGALELRQVVDVGPDLLALVGTLLGLHPDDDAAGVHGVDHSRAPADHRRPGVLDRDVLHAGADQGGLRAEEGHRLALHVRAHEGAVGVVVLQERDQGGRHRHQLLGADVDVVDLLPLGEDEVPRLARGDALVRDLPVLRQLDVGLGDRVLVLLPGGEVEAVGLDLGRLLLAPLDGRVLPLHLLPLDDVPHLVVGLPRVQDLVVLEHPSALHLPVGALDEPELVDAGEAGEARDEADVRALRGLDGADAAVVGRVYVTHLEPGPLPAQPARPEGGEAPLVGDLGEGVRLVHELAELAAPEELADAGHHRLGVDEVVGHGGGHLLVDAHLLLDGPLHPHQPDPELVLQELSHAPHPPVPEVVDVVHVRGAPAQLQHEGDDRGDVVQVQDLLGEGGVAPQLGVELEPAHPREVVFLRVQEHPFEEVAGGVEGRRVSRPHAPVDLDEGLLGALDGVLLDGEGHHGPDVVPLGEEDLEGADLAVLGLDHGEHARGEGLVALQDHLARPGVHHVRDAEGPLQVGLRDLHLRHVQLLELLHVGGGDPLAGVDDLLAPAGGVLGAVDGARELEAGQVLRDLPGELALPHQDLVAAVERAQDVGVRAQAHGPQEDGGEELPLPVDPDVEQVLGVVLELHPAPPVGDDLGREQSLLGLREEHPRRAVELAHDHPLGAVDDEGPVLRHEGDVPEVDLLLLDVADGLGPRLGVLVPDHQADGDLEGDREGHSPLLALVHVVLELQADGLVAGLAGDRGILVQVAALRAVDLAVAPGVRDEGGPAEGAGAPELVEPHQPAALALPVPDRVVHELQGAVLPEVGDREDALKHGLQPRVLALSGQHPHLEEALVGVLLDLDQVRDRDAGLDLREVDPLAVDILGSRIHRFKPPWRTRARVPKKRRTPAGTPPPGVGTLGPERSGSSVLALAGTGYLISTWAPTSSNFFLIAAASSLEIPSFTTLGAPSTRSLASLRPRLVTSRTTLITLIFLSPAFKRWTANSVFSSAAAEAPPPAAGAPAAAIITGAAAAAETPHFCSSTF